MKPLHVCACPQSDQTPTCIAETVASSSAERAACCLPPASSAVASWLALASAAASAAARPSMRSARPSSFVASC